MNHHPQSGVYPHIVVGGGISGLGAAVYAARAGTPTLVLEHNDRVGGCMHSCTFEGLGDFWVEAGSHSCFNSYGNLIEIMEHTGDLARIQAKIKASYRLWQGGRSVSILSALHPFELLGSLPRLFTLKKDDLSVYEYYGRGLGRKNYSDLFGPAFRSVICQTADDFPASALFRKKPRRKDVLRSFTMPGGLAEIPKRFAEQDGIEVRLGAAVGAVTPVDDGYRVELDSGERLQCKSLTLAVPPDVATRLLRDIAPAAAAVTADLGVAEIDSLLLAFEKAPLRVPRLAGLISVDGPFLSAVSRDFLDDPRYRGFAFHFPGGRLEAERQIQVACDALGVSPEGIAGVRHERNRLPSLRKGHRRLIAELDQAVSGQPLAITGNWFLGVSIEDCLTRSHAEMSRLFSALPSARSGSRDRG